MSAEGSDRRSFYRTDVPVRVLIEEEPSQLQTSIGHIRRRVQEIGQTSVAHSQMTIDRLIGVEHDIKEQVKSLVHKPEVSAPSLAYVGVASLVGSIITSRRNFVFRWMTPPLFLIGASAYFLPQTTRNVGERLYAEEKARFPEFAEKHLEVQRNICKTVCGLVRSARSTYDSFNNSSTSSSSSSSTPTTSAST